MLKMWALMIYGGHSLSISIAKKRLTKARAITSNTLWSPGAVLFYDKNFV